jgi:zeaxanthin glucosyltransferase
MTHFGIFCPGAIGHLNPMVNLGRELLDRGHTVTLFGMPDIRAKVTQSGLNFHEIGADDFPLGKLTAAWTELGKLSGLPGLKYSIELFRTETIMLLKEAPAAIQQAGIEALIVDQVSFALGTIADRLQLPFVTICNALPINREPAVPPYFTNWPYQNNPLARLRNQLGNTLADRLTAALWQLVVVQRQAWQLPAYADRDAAASPLAQIAQLPTGFDFPRQTLAPWFHYTGPLQKGRELVNADRADFPWDKLTDQPLIYASLGTLQNQNLEIFETIAAACQDLPAQLVISLGNPDAKLDTPPSWPGQPLVVPYAPHQQLIDRAALVITHAGLNTTIGALQAGVPLVAVPITNEQPGIAARLVQTGAGLSLPVKQLTTAKLRSLVTEVLGNVAYRDRAKAFAASAQSAGGLAQAADIIETAIRTAQPVLALGRSS